MTQSEWNPGRLMGTSGSYWQASALHAGVRLGVFSVLGSQRLDAEGVAKKLGADERAAGVLLNALTAMGLLVHEGERYANTDFARQRLVEGASGYLGHMIRHHHNLVEGWARLHQAVETGTPVRGRSSSSGEESRRDFLMGMHNSASLQAPRVVEQLDLSGRRHLLDLGGGPGTYGIQFCLANPDLRATIFDLPSSRETAEQNIARFEIADRVSFTPGNYLSDPVEGSYDVAWLSHILHAEGPEGCETILKKAASALEPGGMIVVHEFILNDSKDGPLFPALFSLNMLMGTTAGRSYSQGELADMLVRAGAKGVRRVPLDSPNDSGLMAGVV